MFGNRFTFGLRIGFALATLICVTVGVFLFHTIIDQYLEVAVEY